MPLSLKAGQVSTDQRRDRTANARRGLDDKFEKQARELAAANGTEMSPQELAESAERLRRAHFKRLSVKSIASRQAKSLKSRIPAADASVDGDGVRMRRKRPPGGDQTTQTTNHRQQHHDH